MLTEIELIKGCVRQEATCQRILFEQMAGKMFTVCLRYANDIMEAEDILQEGFIKVFNNIHQFKFEGSFEGWVRKIVVNSALKYLQKKRIIFNELKEEIYTNQVTYSYAFSNLCEAELLKLINELPTGYRIVFNLNVIEGYTHEEIGQLLNIQPSTSRSQLVKARKMLQQKIMQIEKIAV
ncbi:MAG: sigma-70 family RNA polymerase sigma factor [Chitinophagaceae bacterium]|nr:sigma-70 family RNA polymerase sigma factor [Chitinophagaceae bacterium]MCW5905455.1 sigma-70 family RNA polymerase sigma factor [Chitinophagaceae bacterium]